MAGLFATLFRTSGMWPEHQHLSLPTDCLPGGLSSVGSFTTLSAHELRAPVELPT